jgi:predicted DNA-binding WGR domain protein
LLKSALSAIRSRIIRNSNQYCRIDSEHSLDAIAGFRDIHPMEENSGPTYERVQFLVLQRIDAAQNMTRFYVLSIEPTLFDMPSLVREWGRIGNRGRRRIDLYSSDAEARVSLASWLERKIKRGYAARRANPRSHLST